MTILVIKVEKEGDYKEGYTYSDGAIVAKLANVRSVRFNDENVKRLMVTLDAGDVEVSLGDDFRFIVEESRPNLGATEGGLQGPFGGSPGAQIPT